MSVGGGAASGGLLAGKAKLVVAALVVVGGGGAAYAATGGDVPFLGGGNGMIGTVPEDVDLVMYMDSSIANDEATNDLAAEFNAMAGAESGDETDIEASFEADTDLSYDGLNSLVVFGKYPDDGSGSGTAVGPGPASQLAGTDYGAALIDSNWAEDDFVDAMEDAPSGESVTVYAEDEYEGYTVYVQQPTEDDIPDYIQDTENPTWVGVIADGKYVVGSEDAVKDALDVNAGEEDAFSGDLRDAYDQTRDGLIKFASAVPEDQVNSGMASQSAENVDYVAGSYYSSGSETLGMELRMITGSSDDAENIIAQIDGGLATLDESVDDDDVKALLDSVETSQSGSTAVVTFEAETSTIADGTQALARGFMGGFGASAATDYSVAAPTDGDAVTARAEPA